MKTNGVIKIESGIPMPVKPRGRGIYPYQELKVGQSFFVPKPIGLMSGSLSYARLKLAPSKFVARSVEGGCRVWRVK